MPEPDAAFLASEFRYPLTMTCPHCFSLVDYDHGEAHRLWHFPDTGYDMDAPVDKSLFPDPSIGNCPGCSNATWHAKKCPWLAAQTCVTPPVVGHD